MGPPMKFDGFVLAKRKNNGRRTYLALLLSACLVALGRPAGGSRGGLPDVPSCSADISVPGRRAAHGSHVLRPFHEASPRPGLGKIELLQRVSQIRCRGPTHFPAPAVPPLPHDRRRAGGAAHHHRLSIGRGLLPARLPAEPQDIPPATRRSQVTPPQAHQIERATGGERR